MQPLLEAMAWKAAVPDSDNNEADVALHQLR